MEFGDYDVSITVPGDHVVASTGVLQNPKEVLTSAQRSRLETARTSDRPVLIVTEEEARENEKTKEKSLKTWRFKADNVRDFAFASSRKFIWDAMAVPLENNTPLAMSFLPQGGQPLVGAVQHRGRRPDPGDLFGICLRVPLPRRHQRPHQVDRHGVPHDLLQWRSTQSPTGHTAPAPSTA